MNDIYESEKVLSEYLLFHYGSDGETLPPDRDWPAGMREALGFPVRTAAAFSAGRATRGLDLGCAVGRSAFEMAGSCDEVTGIDFSHAFIQAAQALGKGGSISYERQDEGRLRTPLVARAPAGGRGSPRFEQGDAMDLRTDLGKFDRIHAANLLCRLRHPQRLLDRMSDLVNPGGELLLATPCTWLEEFTPQENWPAGRTSDWLEESLGAAFELVKSGEEPFLIRETARKFQWTSSLVTVWRRQG